MLGLFGREGNWTGNQQVLSFIGYLYCFLIGWFKQKSIEVTPTFVTVIYWGFDLINSPLSSPSGFDSRYLVLVSNGHFLILGKGLGNNEILFIYRNDLCTALNKLGCEIR